MNGLWTDYIFLAEIEMRESAGGADACSGGSAFSTSAYFGGITAAFDNNTTTSIQSSGVSQINIGYSFPAPVNIVQFAITCTAGQQGRAPGELWFEWADTANTGPYTLFGYTKVTSWASGETKLFTIGSPIARVSKNNAIVARSGVPIARVSDTNIIVARSGAPLARIGNTAIIVARANGAESPIVEALNQPQLSIMC